MRIAVTGSIATDHLMQFPGRFTDLLIGDSLATVSLSFLVDELEIRRGGVAANICLGLARLGLHPLLVGAAGADFAEYGAMLRSEGVDTTAVRISEALHTARFLCTTDTDQNQIASFYAGAMAEARFISLADVRRAAGGIDLLLVGADDPAAMVRHTAAAHDLGVPVAADPSQQLARIDAAQARSLVDGARWLFTNAYEAVLLQERTGWSEAEVLRRVGTWIVTRGADGVQVRTGSGPVCEVPAVPSHAPADPTGVGDAFRAGFLAGVARQLPLDRSAQLGCAMATLALESVGPQDYKPVPAELAALIERTYGPAAVTAVEPVLAGAL